MTPILSSLSRLHEITLTQSKFCDMNFNEQEAEIQETLVDIREDKPIIDLMGEEKIEIVGDYFFRIKHKSSLSSELIWRFGINTSFLDPTGNSPSSNI